MAPYTHEGAVISSNMLKAQASAQGRLSRSMFTRQVSAPAKSGGMFVGATRLPSCKEVDADTSEPEWSPCESEEEGASEDHVSNLDQQTSTIGNSMFKRQVSAPMRLSQGMLVSAPAPSSGMLVGRNPLPNPLPNCEEAVPDEPELEPDDDELFDELEQFMPAPTRQISVMSNFSTGGPSRQVSATSNWSVQELGKSNIQRQETDEHWPSWQGNDPLQAINSEQLDSFTHDGEQASEPRLNTWAVPQQCADSADVHTMPAMLQGCGAMYTWQFVPQPNPQSNADQFGRKRESLIDLAKQQQERQVGKQGEGDVPKASSIKFCPFCGGRFQPTFNFCVFCGKACTGIPSK